MILFVSLCIIVLDIKLTLSGALVIFRPTEFKKLVEEV